MRWILLVFYILNLVADRNAAMNAHMLLNLFFPHEFLYFSSRDSAGLQVGLGEMKRNKLKNEMLTVLARADLDLSQYDFGELTLYWGGKWNQIKNVIETDWRAHHVGLKYTHPLEQDAFMWLHPLIHILDAKEIDKQNLGFELSLGGKMPLGILTFYSEAGGYFKIDEDILASTGDSTIRRLKGKFGFEIPFLGDDFFKVALTAESGKLAKTYASSICPLIEYDAIFTNISAKYCFTQADSDVTDLYLIAPVLSQSSERGQYLDLASRGSFSLFDKLSIDPEFGLILGDLRGWRALISASLGF